MEEEKKTSLLDITLNQLLIMLLNVIIPVSVGLETNSISWGLITLMFIYLLTCLKDELKK